MNDRIEELLELFDRPAFCAKDGIVLRSNRAAEELVPPQTRLKTVLGEAAETYAQWDRENRLQLTFELDGREYDASVSAQEAGDIFVLTQRGSVEAAAAAAVMGVSAALRRPLQEMVLATREIFDTLEENGLHLDSAAELNHAVYRLLRLCGQMSDGGELMLHRKTAHRSPLDLKNWLRGFYEQAEPLVQGAGKTLLLKLPEGACGGNADPALLERAMYNLLVNALLYTPKGGEITLSLEKKERRIFFRVRDNGEGLRQIPQPGLCGGADSPFGGDPRKGIGAGLAMVREIAALHGGSLLVSADPKGGTVVTFSLSQETKLLELHTRTLHFDYCAPYHHGLVELSEALSAKQYHPDEVL